METTSHGSARTFSLIGYLKQVSDDTARVMGKDPDETASVFEFASEFDVQSSDWHVYAAVLLLLAAGSRTKDDLYRGLPPPGEPVSPAYVARTIRRIASREVFGDAPFDDAEWKQNAELEKRIGDAQEAFVEEIGAVWKACSDTDEQENDLCEILRRPANEPSEVTHVAFRLLLHLAMNLNKGMTLDEYERLVASIMSRRAA